VLVFILRNTHTHTHKQIKQREEEEKKEDLAVEHRAVRQEKTQ
jgi:hypothetical protein